MKRKSLCYKDARDYLYNKDRYFYNFVNSMLLRCSQIFEYKNLPLEVPKRVLEKMLLESGYCIFTKHNERYVVLQGGLGGELNEYYEHTECIVNNPYLSLEKTYKLGVDCILMRNDNTMTGLLPTLSRYAVLCNDSEITLNMLSNTMRSQFFLSAGDNATIESAREFVRKLFDGDLAVIAENEFLDGVKTHMVSGAGNYIQQLVELNQYLKASAFNEIGLDANYNMKRERLNESEVELNTSALLPLIDNMLECRKDACNEINNKYGLDIGVELSGVWKAQKESVDKVIVQNETETETEKQQGDSGND